jgi:beta-alanine--pyruvate transaminase
MITFAKGVTSGTVPLAGVIVRRDIYETVVGSAPPDTVEFAHGYTYSGHPLAAAAAEATLALYHEEGLFERARELSPYFEDAVHSLRGTPRVIDVRNFGLMAGIELEPLAGKPGALGFQVFLRCFEKGILTRVTGDIIALSPPLIATRAHVDELVGTIAAVLRELA